MYMWSPGDGSAKVSVPIYLHHAIYTQTYIYTYMSIYIYYF